MSARTRHRFRWTVGSVCVALLLLVGGCGSTWSPAPTAPTSDQVDEMRQQMVTRQAAMDRAARAALLGGEPRDTSQAFSPDSPQSLQAYPHGSMPDTVADSLGRIGAPAVPDLIRALSSPDPRLRQRAALILGRIGPDAALAVPELIRLLDDPDPRMRQAAARTLGQIGPRAAAAVPALIERLEESD